jgi:ABC-type ATPase involved in cell division
VRLGLISFTKLENSRLDKLHQAIAEQQRSMGEIYAQIRTLTDTTYYEYAAIAFLAQEIAKYIEVQQNVQQIEEGVEALLQGQLSPKLLSVELIRQVIANITAELETTAYYSMP